MTITVGSFLMFLAIVCFLIATLGLVPDLRFWRWFPGGALLAAISLFMHIAIRATG